METKFQTSFIPKTTIPSDSTFRPRRHTSFLVVFSFFLFLVSVLLGGLSFGYNKFLEGQLASVQAELKQKIEQFQANTIRGYAKFDNRIDSAKMLLEKHIALSNLLDYLEKETLKSVAFNDFKYELMPDGKSASVAMSGKASGYNAVAYQSTLFGQNTSLKSVLFSDLDLDKIGNVVFKLSYKVDPSFVYYKKKIMDAQTDAKKKSLSFESLIE